MVFIACLVDALFSDKLVFQVQPFRKPGDPKGDQSNRFGNEHKTALGFGKASGGVVKTNGKHAAQHHQAADHLQGVGEAFLVPRPFAGKVKDRDHCQDHKERDRKKAVKLPIVRGGCGGSWEKSHTQGQASGQYPRYLVLFSVATVKEQEGSDRTG
jgi:hypothetical protein